MMRECFGRLNCDPIIRGSCKDNVECSKRFNSDSSSKHILMDLCYAERKKNEWASDQKVPPVDFLIFNEGDGTFYRRRMDLGTEQTYPYFLADDSKPLENNKNLQIRKILDVVKYDAENFESKVYKKVIVNSPTDVFDRKKGEGLRDLVKNWWEGNLRYLINVLWDSDYVCGIPLSVKLPKYDGGDIKAFIKNWLKSVVYYPFPLMKKMALDIEVNPLTQEVTCCSLCREVEKKCLAVSKKAEKPVFGNFSFKDSDGKEHEYKAYLFPTEKQMLLEIFKNMLDVALLITFSGDDYDLKVLHDRALSLGVPKEKIPIVVNYVSETKVVCSFKRGIHIDIMKLFKTRITTYSYPETPRKFSLDEISGITIGKNKLDDPDFTKVSRELLDYCMNDGYLTYEILCSENESLFKMIVILMRIYNIGLEDLCRTSLSKLNSRLIKYVHRKLNYLIPRDEFYPEKSKRLGFDVEKLAKEEKEKGTSKFRGAITESIPGTYFDMDVWDYRSLYPGSIDKYNLSYETIGCSHEECKKNKVPDHEFHVCIKVKGISSALFGALREVRIEFKVNAKEDELSNVVQGALKICMLSGYGIYGAPFSDIAFLPQASAIAAYSRRAVLFAFDVSKKYEIEIKHSDTDSIFVKHLDNETKRKLTEEVFEKTQIELVLDKHYKFIVVSKKKNYLGIKDNGEPDVKGLMGKKRHVCKFMRDLFTEITKVFPEINKPEDLSSAKIKMVGIAKKYISLLMNRKFELKDLAFEVQLSMDVELGSGQDYLVGKICKAHGIELHPGHIILKIKTKGPHSAKPLELTRLSEVDDDAYLKDISGMLNQIFVPLDINFDEIIYGPQKDSVGLKFSDEVQSETVFSEDDNGENILKWVEKPKNI